MATSQHRGPGRPRASRTDEQIREATLELLREQGPGAVSIAAVAARSGIARTTIYRRYADRRALLAAALASVTHQGEPPADLPLAGKLRWLLAKTEEVLRHGIGPGGIAAVLTESDPEFGAALRETLEAGLAPVRTAIDTDLERGVLVADLDADLTLTLVLGTYLAEFLRHGAPTDRRREEIAEQLSRVLAP